MNILPMLIGGVFAATALMLEHWMVVPNYRKVTCRDLPTLTRYVLGVGTLNGTAALVIVLAALTPIEAAIAVVLITTLGGLSVWMSYRVDAWIVETMRALDERRHA